MDDLEKQFSNSLGKIKKKRINSCTKGKTFERLIADELTNKLGIKICRVPMSGGFGTLNSSGVLCGDLMSSDKDVFMPYVIECKHHKDADVLGILFQKNSKILEWLDQNERDSKRINKIPILIFRRNNSPIFTILKYDNHDKNNIIDITKIIVFFYNGIKYLLTQFDNFNWLNDYNSKKGV